VETITRISRKLGIDPVWQPLVLEMKRPDHREILEDLERSTAVFSRHDTIVDQIRSLVSSRDPTLKTASEVEDGIREFLGGRDPDVCGTWIHYPWSGRLVHVLDAAEFRELRFDRNRYKITQEEQERLREFRIGFIGLSVGQIIAMTMALEGIGGCYRLADCDTLDLTNLNRLRAGVHELGESKAAIIARQIFEIDPYLDISLFPGGIVEGDLDRFFLDGGKLNLLVEECDDLFIKVRSRERARDLAVPVLMETCEGGILDVERFDLEPGRKILHGLLGGVEASSLRGLDRAGRIPYVLGIAGQRLSDRAAATIVEIGHTTSSLPQLASAVTLGAGLAADAARRILLGSFHDSGRFRVDAGEMVRDGAAEGEVGPGPIGIEVSPLSLELARPRPPARVSSAIGEGEIRSIVEHAVLAPSAGNCQPWRFVFHDGALDCMIDPGRTSILDFQRLASHLAIGAAVENIVLAAAGHGREVEVTPIPEPGNRDLACRISFARSRGSSGRPDLLDQVPLRATNRKAYERTPLGRDDIGALAGAAESAGARLEVLTGREDLDEMGSVLGQVDRLELTCEATHGAMFAELRWTTREVEETRDGIDIATMDFTAADAAALRVLSSWPAMRMLGSIGGGRALEKAARRAVAASPAMGLVTIEGAGPERYLLGGRAVQRMWLAATARGVAVHPWTGICYLLARLEGGGADIFSEAQAREIGKLGGRCRGLFGVRGGWTDLLLFRLGRAGAPRVRSLRRRIDDVLALER